MSHTVPDITVSREPVALSFGIRMRPQKFMATPEGCRAHPKKNALSGNIVR